MLSVSECVRTNRAGKEMEYDSLCSLLIRTKTSCT